MNLTGAIGKGILWFSFHVVCIQTMLLNLSSILSMARKKKNAALNDSDDSNEKLTVNDALC